MLRTPVSCAVLLALVLFTALSVPAATWAADPDFPDPVNIGAVDVTGTTATFKATVDPHGSLTVARFEYGLSKDALQRTPDIAVGAGEGPMPFDVPVTGLVANRRYYVQVYASNAIGEVWATLVEFRTPRPPNILQAGETDITQTSATLHVKVMGYGLPVTLTTSATGADGSVVAAAPVTATADGIAAVPIVGLQPGMAYRWTSTGTNVAGQDGTYATFRTRPLAGMPRPSLSARYARYGSQVTLTGTTPGYPGLPVALQKQPLMAPAFAPVPGATGTTDAQGIYRFTFPALESATYGVTAANFVAPGPANTVALRVYAALDVQVKRARRHRYVVSGRIRPDVPAKAVLYRRNHGRVGVSVTPVSSGANSRTFRFPARKLKPGSYDVRLTIEGTPGVDPTRSAAFRIPRR